MSNNKQQTAVDWLAEQMMHPSIHNPYIEQAKEMDQRQKILDYEIGYINGGNQKKITGEQYYNETYGGGEQ